jgi:hypothetical protein
VNVSVRNARKQPKADEDKSKSASAPSSDNDTENYVISGELIDLISIAGTPL